MLKYISFQGVLLLIAGFLASYTSNDAPQASAQIIHISASGDLSGRVIIPINNTNTRRFRGSGYRNRGGSSNSTNSSDENTSPYVNTIVSAHPVSYELPNDISGKETPIRQKNAEFTPNVTPVTVGTIVQFVNDDPFFHNVFSLTPGSRFNIGRRPTGDVYSRQIDPPKWKVTGVGPISLFCDIHSQMNATILSLDTPYFTRVNEDGTFTLPNLPDGEYEIRVFSPGLEIISQNVTIQSNQETSVTLNVVG